MHPACVIAPEWSYQCRLLRALTLVFCVQYCKEALRNFFERFLEVFEPWTPRESTVPGYAARESMQAAVGCKAGHPSSVLAAIVEAVERISSDFGRGK